MNLIVMNNSKFFFKNFIKVLLISILFFSACKKEVNIPPTISVHHPLNNSTYLYSDTVPFSIWVEDDHMVLSVSIHIADKNMKPVTQTLNIPVNRKGKQIDDIYVFADDYIESDQYYLVFSARDNVNITNAYVNIYITGLQRKLKNIFYIIEDGTNYSLIKHDSLGSGFEQLLNFSNKPLSISCNSYAQQIIVLFDNGVVNAYDAETMEIVWSKANLNNQQYNFNGKVFSKNKFSWVSSAGGKIFLYDKEGVVRHTINTSSINHQPLKYLYYANNVYTYSEGFGASQNSISCSKYIGGVNISNYPIDFEVIDISPYKSNQVIIWAKTNEGEKLYTYNPDINYLYQYKNLPETNLTSICYASTENQFAAIGSIIYSYNPLSNSFMPFSQNRASFMVYDDLSNRIISSHADEVKIIDAESGNVINNYSMGGIVLMQDILYNRE